MCTCESQGETLEGGGALHQAIFKNFISRSEISQYDIHKLAFGLGVIMKIRSLIKYFLETLVDCKNGHMLSIALICLGSILN